MTRSDNFLLHSMIMFNVLVFVGHSVMLSFIGHVFFLFKRSYIICLYTWSKVNENMWERDQERTKNIYSEIRDRGQG